MLKYFCSKKLHIRGLPQKYPGRFNFSDIVLYCIMRPYTDGPIGPLSYRHSSEVVRNPHSALAE